jgi:predicted Rossmann-fold nucleotide-binding protein
MMNFPRVIISGGQTGADRAGLDFALARGIRIKGYCPLGRVAFDGPLHRRYRLTETATSDYRERTRLNAALADVTVIFDAVVQGSPGTRLALGVLREHRKPFVLLKNFPDVEADVAAFCEFIRQQWPRSMNVAGNSEERTAGIYAHVLAVLNRVYETLERG